VSAAAIASILAVVIAALVALRRVLAGPPPAVPTIRTGDDHTTVDPETGAVTSIQSADLEMPVEELEQIWTPMHLERLARTYWRYLSRVTLGLIRVTYGENERYVVFLLRPIVLLSFRAPEYEMDDRRGLVRWRIDRGLLVAPRGRGRGYLEIEIERHPPDADGRARLHVVNSVASFYPAIAFGISRFIYENTQSRVHVLVTHGFLRSLARLELEESKVGRFAGDASAP
jgi:hypothetical protein